MKKDFNKVLRNEKGFTLIEIIVVLIILGILAAIIVPKYFGLESEAGEKAAKGVVAEMQARANLLYASSFMNANNDQTPKEYYDANAADLTSDMGDYEDTINLSAGTVGVPGSSVVCNFTYTEPNFDDGLGPNFNFDKCSGS